MQTLTITEIRYWYFHQTDAKRKEIQESIGYLEVEINNNSIFVEMGEKFTDEILVWYSN